jgi:hypothetical protein
MGTLRGVWEGWSDELAPLKLSRAGNLAATAIVLLVLVVGVLAAITGVAFALYNLFSGRDSDNAVAVQIVFTLGAVFVFLIVAIGASLVAVLAVDAAARGIRWSVRQALAKPS